MRADCSLYHNKKTTGMTTCKLDLGTELNMESHQAILEKCAKIVTMPISLVCLLFE